MTETGGLRTLKKERTRQALADVAISLFLTKGFEQVPVAEIAAAAEVSKPTLFRYFASKEDLVLHRFADHLGEAARVVLARPAGQLPLTALRQHFLDRLAEHDPATGHCDHPDVIAFQRLVYETRSLSSHLRDFLAADTEALAGALAGAVAGQGELAPRLIAAQYVAVRQELTWHNWTRLAAGATADEAFPQAAAEAELAFALLGTGAAGLGYGPG
ncbi:AcrR family transcriptional regulator [Kitasatospora herbaricolor]|uniref:TetR/AcrR family transcriptional regulator n=1 Tax=Kitasatospora herbaricolor TaxID=68217 RepID=UPI00174C194E|nr:TetR/AcrR family transcriptional regulator [Kitasatospora herbaricolor]MDQ0311966.1 AcrR family transcriptional regulator [Kitasatospora herbaricolor]